MLTSEIKIENNSPALILNGDWLNPTTAYVGPRYLQTFLQAGIKLFTFYVPGIWWVGENRYDFSAIDAFIQNYASLIPGAYFMPRIDLSGQGFPWWGEAHPDEMNVLLDAATGQARDQLEPNPAAIPYLGHEVNLNGINLHSFHSSIWRKEAGQAIASLITHCEGMPYADQVWGWHICNGLFCEWFHWNEYSFAGMADYSPAAQADFRRWLRDRYHNDPLELIEAWGRKVAFETASIPLPSERLRPHYGEFYDPHLDRPTIDYTQCFNEATVDNILSVCQAAKQALPQPKVICVFYGYQFSNMPRPQLNAHYALEKLLASPYVDMIASPHSYSHRGEGGYHAAQSLSDCIRRAGKLHFDEIDCKTAWTPTSVTWKTHISQPKTAEGTIEMMKKDAAFALASGTALWWMDLTDEGWFNVPELVDPIRKLQTIEDRLQALGRKKFGEVALVVSQQAMLYMAPREGLHNATLKIQRNWFLSRIGAPFEVLEVNELGQTGVPDFKFYILANLFYLSAKQRQRIDEAIKHKGATALWIYAPGFMDDHSASLDNMASLTGLSFGSSHQDGEMDVTITDNSHPITQGLPLAYAYGTGVNRDRYLNPPKIQYMPQTKTGLAFFVDDPGAQVLGIEEKTRKPGLVVKEFSTWRSIYSAAPLLSSQILRNIARLAGVHIYSENDDMVWGNDHFLAINCQSAGKRTVRFPGPITLEDAYTGQLLGSHIQELVLDLALWETRLFYVIQE